MSVDIVTTVGIDPGSSGAVVSITYSKKQNKVLNMEAYKLNGAWNPYGLSGKDLEKSYDNAQHLSSIFTAIMALERHGAKVFVEDVKPFKGMSAKTVFSFSMNIGYIYLLLSQRKIPFTSILPKVWQDFIGTKTKSKDKNHKQEIADLMADLYPEYKHIMYGTRGGLMDGIADAMGIAHTGLRLILQEEENKDE